MTEHHERENNAAGDLSHTAQRVAEVGHEAASKVAGYVRDGVDRTTRYAKGVSEQASERIADVTGRPPEQWARQLRQFVEESPLRAMAIAIAVGYVAGRVMRRG